MTIPFIYSHHRVVYRAGDVSRWLISKSPTRLWDSITERGPVVQCNDHPKPKNNLAVLTTVHTREAAPLDRLTRRCVLGASVGRP